MCHVRSTVLRLLSAVAATLPAVTTAGAQAEPPSAPPATATAAAALDVPAVAPKAPGAPACARTQPASAFRRAPVFVYGEVADSADRAARPSVDLAADMVARRLRAALGAADRLAAADSLVWQGDLVEGVRVTVRRDGRTTWRRAAGAAATAGDRVPAGVAFLTRALAAAADSGELFVPPDLIRGDSLVYVLKYTHPVPRAADGTLSQVGRRNPAPIFTLSVARLMEAAPLPGEFARNLRYPTQLQMGGFQGHVVLQFLVDTAGRAVRESVSDANPHVATSLAPHLRGAYLQFFAAARDAALRSRFTPASIAGCPVRQLVSQPVTYELLR